MRKLIYSVFAILCSGLILKSFANNTSANIILEKNTADSIYSGHHSHCSHASHAAHASHYSTHTINRTDSIESVSSDAKLYASENLLSDSLMLRRIYLSDAFLTRSWNENDSIYSGKTIVLITTELNNPKTIHWLYIPLCQEHKAFHTSSAYMNTVGNSTKSIDSNCPICADYYKFKPWMADLVNIIKYGGRSTKL